MKLRTFAWILVALFVTATASIAATDNFTIDPKHSAVGFTVRHFFSKVPGKFATFSGTISGDSANLGISTVSATIDAASIDTGVTDRDNHLRSADFFDVAKFPTITFQSKKVAVKSPTNIIITGDLTMHGVTKSVDLDVQLLGSGPDPWGGFRAGLEAHTTIDRKEFGIVWNKVLDSGGAMLGDTVEITLQVEAVKDKAPK